MAGTIIMFDSFQFKMWKGDANLSDTFRVAFLKSSWTPSIDTSSVASLTAHMCTTLSGGPADHAKQVPGTSATIAEITKSADGVLKFDLSNIVCTASSGTNLCAQYGVIFGSGGTSPAFYWQLSSAEVVTGSLNLTWPDPVYETSDNV